MKPKVDTTKLATEKLTEDKKMGYPGHSLSSMVAEAILVLDHYFGEGYAKAHPELVGSCLQALAVNDLCFGNIEDAVKEIASAIDYVGKQMEPK
jgi:hypothetical protein